MTEPWNTKDGGWNTAPHITCPACGHEFQTSVDHEIEAGLVRECPACHTELTCARVTTIVEWKWRTTTPKET